VNWNWQELVAAVVGAILSWLATLKFVRGGSK
jgi:hypothetical protein